MNSNTAGNRETGGNGGTGGAGEAGVTGERGGGPADNPVPTNAVERYLVAAGRSVRVQALGEATLRVELARPDGSFADTPTFTVPDRPAPRWTLEGVRIEVPEDAETAEEAFRALTLRYEGDGPSNTTSRPAGRSAGDVLYRAADDPAFRADPPEPDRFPRPSELGPVWVLHDMPRVLPPSARDSAADPGLPAQAAVAAGAYEHSWQLDAEALDLYIVLCNGDYELFRREILALTGRPPLPPRWTFGYWHSRYYPYRADDVLELIGEYDRRSIPLDVFVIDTDWREGASRGYRVNTELFPDMPGLLQACADRGVHTVFNDHPEPKGMAPLDPELFRYRRENLTRLLDMGLSGWWFDRNWGEIIDGPVPGLETAAWGERLYHDIIQGHRPNERPAVLSMVAPHPASHRYPLHWTGDIRSDWYALKTGVRDSIDEGYRFRAYTGQDIGGHVGFPSPEQYVRWLQWGAVSPTMRLHAGPRNRFREPWKFGDTAAAIAEEYIRFRYRLLALLYSAAFENHLDGTPILRGMDFVTQVDAHAQLPEAQPADPGAALTAPHWAEGTQFLLGPDLLVAPVTHGAGMSHGPTVNHGADLAGGCAGREPSRAHFDPPLRRRVWYGPDPGRPRGSRGTEVPDRAPDEVGFDDSIRLDAVNASEVRKRWSEGFYLVWDGAFTAEQDGWYHLVLRGNGLKGLALDEGFPPQLLRHFDAGTQEGFFFLEAGEHRIFCSFEEAVGTIPECELLLDVVPDPAELPPVAREVWLPPGRWRDLWTGTIHPGPAALTTTAALHQLPAFVRLGAVLPVSPVRPRTAGLDRIVCDIFPDEGGFATDTLIHDDDGHSTAYLRGDYRRIPIRCSREGERITVSIGAAGADLPATLRIHLPAGEEVAACSLDSWRRIVSASAERRRTPLALTDGVAQFADSATLLVELPAGGVKGGEGADRCVTCELSRSLWV